MQLWRKSRQSTARPKKGLPNAASRYLTFPPGRLEQLIVEMGWTLKDFAQLLDVSEFTAGQWVRGKSKPYATKLPQFLEIFGLESELQLYDQHIAKKFSDAGLLSIGSGDVDLGGLLVRLDGLAKRRMAFWDALRVAYAQHSKETAEKGWPSLQQLADRAHRPRPACRCRRANIWWTIPRGLGGRWRAAPQRCTVFPGPCTPPSPQAGC